MAMSSTIVIERTRNRLGYELEIDCPPEELPPLLVTNGIYLIKIGFYASGPKSKCRYQEAEPVTLNSPVGSYNSAER